MRREQGPPAAATEAGPLRASPSQRSTDRTTLCHCFLASSLCNISFLLPVLPSSVQPGVFPIFPWMIALLKHKDGIHEGMKGRASLWASVLSGRGRQHLAQQPGRGRGAGTWGAGVMGSSYSHRGLSVPPLVLPTQNKSCVDALRTLGSEGGTSFRYACVVCPGEQCPPTSQPAHAQQDQAGSPEGPNKART